MHVRMRHNDQKLLLMRYRLRCSHFIRQSNSNARQEIRHASRICIRRFINEPLSSLKFQCCYRSAYFIDRTPTRINRRRINRYRAAVWHETDLRSRRERTTLLDFVSLSSSLSLSLPACRILIKNRPQKRNVSCEPVSVSFFSRSGNHDKASSKILNVIGIIHTQFISARVCIKRYFTQYMKNVWLNHGCTDFRTTFRVQ